MRLQPGNSFTLGAAAAWAAAELILGLTLGNFLGAGRAEFVAFLSIRPLLLIAAAAFASPWPWRSRWAFYVIALLVASIGESLLVLAVGNPDPGPELLRGLAASLLSLLAADLLVQSGRRWHPLLGWIVAAALVVVLLVPAVRSSWTVVAMGPGDGPPAEHKARLLLMTSLPIVWGDHGAFDPRSRPSETYRVLQEGFDVRPIDALDERNLGRNQLLLMAQPRWLAPSELVALDDWVRNGGRAFILADPKLDWPSDLPIGDIRRPAPVNLLGPLLAHWGLSLTGPSQAGRKMVWVRSSGYTPRRKVILESPGSFQADGAQCDTDAGPMLAQCSIGSGHAMLMADADLMRDDLWTAPGPNGAARHRRTADNPLAIVDLLERVVQLGRERPRRPVVWADPGARLAPAIVFAFLPTLLLLALSGLPSYLKRIRPHLYPQAYKG